MRWPTREGIAGALEGNESRLGTVHGGDREKDRKAWGGANSADKIAIAPSPLLVSDPGVMTALQQLQPHLTPFMVGHRFLTRFPDDLSVHDFLGGARPQQCLTV